MRNKKPPMCKEYMLTAILDMNRKNTSVSVMAKRLKGSKTTIYARQKELVILKDAKALESSKFLEITTTMGISYNGGRHLLHKLLAGHNLVRVPVLGSVFKDPYMQIDVYVDDVVVFGEEDQYIVIRPTRLTKDGDVPKRVIRYRPEYIGTKHELVALPLELIGEPVQHRSGEFTGVVKSIQIASNGVLHCDVHHLGVNESSCEEFSPENIAISALVGDVITPTTITYITEEGAVQA